VKLCQYMGNLTTLSFFKWQVGRQYSPEAEREWLLNGRKFPIREDFIISSSRLFLLRVEMSHGRHDPHPPELLWAYECPAWLEKFLGKSSLVLKGHWRLV